jgi:hypothetical protein
MRARQLDLFVAEPASRLTGIHIKLDRPIDREQPCCRNVCVVGRPRGPHPGELTCVDCGQHRGWLGKVTGTWLEDVIEQFGMPNVPIVIRKSHTFQEEDR